MALLDTHGHPIIDVTVHLPTQAAVAGQPLINVNQLKMAFSNPKADIPLFYGNYAMDSLSPKLFFGQN